jgi:hypothetical protein
MPGLVPGIHVLLGRGAKDVDGRDKPGHDGRNGTWRSKQRIVQLLPFWIHVVNQSNLPRARPMLDCLFALDGGPDVVVPLVVDKHLQSVSFREAVNQTFAVLIGSGRQIARHAHVERAVPSVRHEVDPATHAFE